MPTIKDIIGKKDRKVITVDHSSTIIDALKIMAIANIGCLMVVDKGIYVGVFTERDYARKIILEGRASNTTVVSEIMEIDLPVLHYEDSMEDCSKIMTEKKLRYLPIFENGVLANIISQSDIIKYTIEAQKSLIEHLQDYINLK